MRRSRSTPSHGQPDLLGGVGGGHIHRLFLALVPGEEVARQAQAAAWDVAKAQQLHGRMLRPSRYHVTLHFLGDYPMLREDVVRACTAAAGKVVVPSFELVLDEVAGFKGREPPCILRCSQVPPALEQLWDELRRALLLAGAGQHLERQFTPHLTYAYSDGAVPATVPIEPIRWRVERLSLLHNVVGAGDYRTLESWQLATA